MRTCVPQCSPCVAVALASALALGSVRAEVEGIIEPLNSPCEAETHRIVDPCTGNEQLLHSSWLDLGPYECQQVAADGTPSGFACPGLDLQSISATTPACTVEIRDVTLHEFPGGTSMFVPHLVCADTYDVIVGVLGVPAVDACDDLHPCPAGSYCEKFPGDCGGVGHCKVKPPACVFVWIPVCGCDGVTYSNSCFANMADAPVACGGVCPCPPACTVPEGCLEVGPVLCEHNDVAATPYSRYLSIQQADPPVGQALYLFVRAKGPGVVGVTTYGLTTDGEERLFAGDCPR